MITDDQYAGLCMTVKSLQSQHAANVEAIRELSSFVAMVAGFTPYDGESATLTGAEDATRCINRLIPLARAALAKHPQP